MMRPQPPDPFTGLCLAAITISVVCSLLVLSICNAVHTLNHP